MIEVCFGDCSTCTVSPSAWSHECRCPTSSYCRGYVKQTWFAKIWTELARLEAGAGCNQVLVQALFARRKSAPSHMACFTSPGLLHTLVSGVTTTGGCCGGYPQLVSCTMEQSVYLANMVTIGTKSMSLADCIASCLEARSGGPARVGCCPSWIHGRASSRLESEVRPRKAVSLIRCPLVSTIFSVEPAGSIAGKPQPVFPTCCVMPTTC